MVQVVVCMSRLCSEVMVVWGHTLMTNREFVKIPNGERGVVRLELTEECVPGVNVTVVGLQVLLLIMPSSPDPLILMVSLQALRHH